MKYSIIKACFSALGIMHSILRKMKYNPYSITTYSEDPNKKSHLYYLEISSIRTGLFWSELLLFFFVFLLNDHFRQTEFWCFSKKAVKSKKYSDILPTFDLNYYKFGKISQQRSELLLFRPIFIRIFSKLSRVVLLEFLAQVFHHHA